MSENISPASESALEAVTPAATTTNDNALEGAIKPSAEATNPEHQTEPTQVSPKKQASKREPKQGVRDARANKSSEASQDEAKADGSDKVETQPDSPQEETSKKPNQQNSQQANQQNNRGRGRRGRKGNEANLNQPQAQQIKLDPKSVAKKAWKIFLAEVSEEGLALIGDKEAKELTKRSFRLGEIFHEEEQRRQIIAKEKAQQEKEREKAEKERGKAQAKPRPKTATNANTPSKAKKHAEDYEKKPAVKKTAKKAQKQAKAKPTDDAQANSSDDEGTTAKAEVETVAVSEKSETEETKTEVTVPQVNAEINDKDLTEG